MEQTQTEINIRKRKLTQRIDNLKFSKWHYLMIASLGTTWIFDGFEVGMLSLVSLKLKDYFDKTESQITLIASLYLVGCCSGALIFGSLAYNYGRKQLFYITLSIYLVAVIGTIISTDYYEFIVFRILTGIAVGGEYTAIFAAVDEFIPPQNRGYTDVVIDGTWHFGSCWASIMSIIIFSSWDDSTYSWRLLFSIGIIGAVIVIFLRQNIPESPRWLILQNKFRSAQKIVNYIEFQCQNNKLISQKEYENQIQSSLNQGATLDEEGNEIEDEVDEEPNQTNNLFKQTKIILHMLCRFYPKRFILGATLMSCQAFFYQGIFYTFAMNLNTFYGVEDNETGYYVIPLSVSSFMGPVLLGRYFDTIGRRKMVLYTYTFVAGFLTLTSILFQTDNMPLGLLIVCLSITFIVASPGASSAHLIVSEIFPSEMRSQVLAIFYAVGFGSGGVIAPSIFGIMIEKKSRDLLALGYYIAAFLMLVGGIVGYIFGIDAENKSLEDVSDFEKDQQQIITKKDDIKEALQNDNDNQSQVSQISMQPN